MRLIDANALISNLRTFKGLGAMVAGTLVRFAEKQPTVDAVEVVHGHWANIVDYGGGNCYGFCSACAAEQKAQNTTALRAFHKYCRWCGAKMDGGNEDG